MTRGALAASDGAAILDADRSVDRDGLNGSHLAAEAMVACSALRVGHGPGTRTTIRQRERGMRERALLAPRSLARRMPAPDDLTD